MTYLNANGTTAEEQPGAQLTSDAWGMDMIVRKWSIKTANAIDFVRILRKNRNLPDSVFNALTLAGYTATLDRAWTHFDVTFKGLLDGLLPKQVYSGGSATLNVQLEFQDEVLKQLAQAFQREYTPPTTQLTYKAPFAVIRYVTREVPKAPKYANDLNGADPIVKIVNQTGARGAIDVVPLSQPRVQNVPIIAGLPTPTALPPKEGKFNGISNIVTDGPSYSPVGQFYECEEKNQLTIMPFDFATLLWSINLGQVTTAPPQNIT
jgi:hypothetical protein